MSNHESLSASSSSPAADNEVLDGLVCGYPARERDCALVAMVHSFAFADETEMGMANGFFALGGYLATVETWKRFSDAWQAELDKEPKLPAIHMTDFMRRSGPGSLPITDAERALRIGNLAQIVLSHDVHPFVVHVDRSPWDEHVKRHLCQHKIRDYSHPYGLAAAWLSMQLIQHGDKVLRDFGRVHFVFDWQERIGALMKASIEVIMRSYLIYCQPHMTSRLGEAHWASPGHRHVPLQAADILMWQHQRQFRKKSEPVPSVIRMMDKAGRLALVIRPNVQQMQHHGRFVKAIPCDCGNNPEPPIWDPVQ